MKLSKVKGRGVVCYGAGGARAPPLFERNGDGQ